MDGVYRGEEKRSIYSLAAAGKGTCWDMTWGRRRDRKGMEERKQLPAPGNGEGEGEWQAGE